MRATPRGPLPPLRTCPTHGARYRSWREGAFGPCCLADDRLRPINENDLAFAEALGASLLAWQRSLAIELDSKLIAARRQARSSFTRDYQQDQP